MFIAQQYNFGWNETYLDAFLDYEAPRGIEGHRVEVDFARVWDAL